MQPHNPPPPAVVFDWVMSFFRARMLQVFAELGVADAIAEGRDPGVNERFLKAAASAGLLQSLESGNYALTPIGEVMRSGAHGSMRAFAAAVLGGAHYKAWGNLAHSARTEGNAFLDAFGEDVWSHFTKTNPTEGALFNGAMQSMSEGVLRAILDVYELPAQGLVVDIAGGVGAMLCEFLKKQPGLRGIVMDLEFSRAAAEAYIAAQNLRERCSFAAGDFFQAVPAGGDLYTMKWILHDWSDEKSTAILRAVHDAMPAHAKLALFEAVVPLDDATALSARMMDLNMMVMCGGKERTEAEWRALLGANGFNVDRIVPTPTPYFVIEASKARRPV